MTMFDVPGESQTDRPRGVHEGDMSGGLPGMSQPTSTAEARFAAIVEELLGSPDVTPPVGQGFGASGLKVRGKIFAMLSSKGEFVVKLPKPRVNALVTAGDGDYFDPGHGRLMKEWVAIAPTSGEDWLPLAREARAFVAAQH